MVIGDYETAMKKIEENCSMFIMRRTSNNLKLQKEIQAKENILTK